MQPENRARNVMIVPVLACWFLGNVLLYIRLESSEVPASPGHRMASCEARRLFNAMESRLGAPSEQRKVALLSRFMSPANMRPGSRYPLVIFLHGSGQKGSDNQSQLLGLPEQLAEADWRKQFPCFVLAPQCPEYFQWTNLDDELIGLIRDMMAREPVDPTRVYLTGLSMGGFGCWALSIKEPDLFAAVIPVCGGGDPTSANRLINVAIWAVHGDVDDVVPVERSRTMIAAIREAGGQPNYTELKGVGHNIWTQTYRDPNGVLKWMFAQRKQRIVRRSAE